jgi:hypothetical protein
MSVNKYKPHVFVIPEDDADRQIADGFVLHPRVSRQVQVVEPAGGWARVVDTFKEEYLPLLRQHIHTHVVMVVDFDGDAAGRRRSKFEAEIPEVFRARVFVIGPRDTPESLRQSTGKRYEDIGRLLADDCDGDQAGMWGHELLRHNEVDRLRLFQTVRAFVFA